MSNPDATVKPGTTGRAPIERRTLLQLMNAIVHAGFPPPSTGLPELSGPMENAMAGAFELQAAALAVSEPRQRVSSNAPTQPPRRRTPVSPRRPPLLSLAAASAYVLAVAGVALLAAAPSAPPVERPRAAAFEAPSPPPEPTPPTSAPAPAASAAERLPTLEPVVVVQLPVTGQEGPGPYPGGAMSLEAPTTASDKALPRRAPQPKARAKRRTRSQQRPPRSAVAAQFRPAAASSSAAACDPLRPPEVQPTHAGAVRAGRGLLTSPSMRAPDALGPNQSPIFD